MSKESKMAGQMLRSARNAAEKSQRALAELLGVKFQQLSAWERGDEVIPEKYLEALCGALPTLNIQNLRMLVVSGEKRLILDDSVATRQLQQLIGGRKGEIVVFSGKPVSFSNPELSASAVEFLRDEANKLTFILAPMSEDLLEYARNKNSGTAEQVRAILRFARNTSLQEIVKLREELSQGVSSVKKRISFLALPPSRDTKQKPGTSTRLLELSRLLHPLAVTLLFEPKNPLEQRAGFLFFTYGSGVVSKGDYGWLRLSPEFLADLSELLRVTLRAQDRKTLFHDVCARVARL